MLTVSGSAEFIKDGKKLKLQVRIQPHVPVEHERLERIAASEDNTFALERGNLVWNAELEVPGPTEAAPAGETPSPAESLSTPASESAKGPSAPPIELGPEWLMAGDLVQWESQGVNQFAEPQYITKFSADGKFAFFEGSETGVPVEGLKRVAAAQTDSI